MSIEDYRMGYRDGYNVASAKQRDLLAKIAEVGTLVECSSLSDWREKVKKMCANALKEKLHE